MWYYLEFPRDGKSERVILDYNVLLPIGTVLTYFPHNVQSGETSKDALELRVINIQFPTLRADWIRMIGRLIEGGAKFDVGPIIVETELVNK